MNFELQTEETEEVARVQEVLVGGKWVGTVFLRASLVHHECRYNASLQAFAGPYGMIQGFGPTPAAAIASAIETGRHQAQQLTAGVEALAARLGERA